MDDKSFGRLALTISGHEKRLSINKSIIKALSCPSYICIRVSQNYDSIILKSCKPVDPMSFKVPENIFINENIKMELNSKAFVESLCLANGLNIESTYSFEGEYIEKYNVVKVTIKK
jgi:hypothetical protein